MGIFCRDGGGFGYFRGVCRLVSQAGRPRDVPDDLGHGFVIGANSAQKRRGAPTSGKAGKRLDEDNGGFLRQPCQFEIQRFLG